MTKHQKNNVDELSLLSGQKAVSNNGIKPADTTYNSNTKKTIEPKNDTMYDMSEPLSGAFVGFLASPLESRYYQQDNIILFDDVLLNPSNVYNESSGVFTCPYSGFYYFSALVMNDDNHEGLYERIDVALGVIHKVRTQGEGGGV